MILSINKSNSSKEENTRYPPLLSPTFSYAVVVIDPEEYIIGEKLVPYNQTTFAVFIDIKFEIKIGAPI